MLFDVAQFDVAATLLARDVQRLFEQHALGCGVVGNHAAVIEIRE